MGKNRNIRTFVFSYNDKSKSPVSVDATSKGKAWKKFRRVHEPHAKRKDFTIV